MFVTDVAGTTRDLVEGTVRLNGITLNLIDTAGIRKSDDTIEQNWYYQILTRLEKHSLYHKMDGLEAESSTCEAKTKNY